MQSKEVPVGHTEKAQFTEGGDHTMRVMGDGDNILWRDEMRERVVDRGGNALWGDRVPATESGNHIWREKVTLATMHHLRKHHILLSLY